MPHKTIIRLSGVARNPANGFPARPLEALYPLARATLDNVAKDGVAASLTGPAFRGDAATIRLHLDALSQRATELLPVYAALTATSLPLALQRGLSPNQVSEIEQLIDNSQ